MKQIDIYSGWIVAFVDGMWRHFHIPAGNVTIAEYFEPNKHIAVFKKEDVGRGEGMIEGQPIERSVALVAGPLVDKDVLERIAFVRFGRIGKKNDDCFYLVDGWLMIEINRDLGPDCLGLGSLVVRSNKIAADRKVALVFSRRLALMSVEFLHRRQS